MILTGNRLHLPQNHSKIEPMFTDIALSVPLFWGGIILLTGWLLYRALPTETLKHHFAFIACIWCVLQTIIGLSGWYLDTTGLPPRFTAIVVPPVLFILYLLNNKKAASWIQNIDLKRLTYLHMVRIPVEIALLQLYHLKKIPQMMTFEGHNFDILSGITALLVGFFAFNGQMQSKRILIIWNILGLCLLGIIVGTAALSLPTPFQQLAFDQPNIAVLRFPFLLLPGFIVPIVLFAHLAALKQLIFKKERN